MLHVFTARVLRKKEGRYVFLVVLENMFVKRNRNITISKKNLEKNEYC